MRGLSRHRDLSVPGSLLGNFRPEALGHYGMNASRTVGPVAGAAVALLNPITPEVSGMGADIGFNHNDRA